MTYRTDLITGLIRDVPDFPEPGVTFKDITPLLANANGYAAAISELVDTAPRGVDVVLGLEYGSATLTVHQDAVQPGSKVLIVDDILATAGTVGATASLVEKLGGELVGVSVLMELSALGGREKLDRAGIGPVNAVITV